MDDDQMTFDFWEGQERKDQGMQAAAMSNHGLLALARDVAHYLGRHGEPVNADMVHQYLNNLDIGYKPSYLGNAAGSIFTDGTWVLAGHTTSQRVSNHGREFKNWIRKEFA
jgi:hypothetical protein